MNKNLQQYGAPPHYKNIVRQYLHQKLPNRWTESEHPFPWPPQYPDFIPSDFFFCGCGHGLYKKPRISRPPENITDFMAILCQEFASITEETLQKVFENAGNRILFEVRYSRGHLQLYQIFGKRRIITATLYSRSLKLNIPHLTYEHFKSVLFFNIL